MHVAVSRISVSPPLSALWLQPAQQHFGPSLRRVNVLTNTDPKIPIRADLTMNPGASWTSSMGMVRSRIATSPKSSSAIGTTGWAARWAMEWNWEAQLFSEPGGNLSVDLLAAKSEKWLTARSPARRYHSLPVVHVSPAAWLPVLHFTWDCKVWPEFMFSPFLYAWHLLLGQWMKAAPRILVPWSKKCFYYNQKWWEEKPAAHYIQRLAGVELHNTFCLIVPLFI